ncbi:sensor histidine kinase [Amycolatopsis stemonae]
MRRLSLWMRAHPMAGDTVLAVLLGLIDMLLFVADQFAELPELPPWYVAVPINIAMVAPLVFRRKSPLWSAYVVLVVSIVHATLMLGIGSAAGLAMSLYSVVVYAGRRQGLVFVGAVILSSAVQLALAPPDDELVIAIVFLAFGIALCWTLGEFVGARRAYDVEVEARLHLLETERDQATRIAVAEERGRIARELHDVVAHAVSVMVVQADGASYAIESNPELAQRALQTISETGRGALGELRRLLDVLRSDDADGEPRVPQPDAHALAELAERMRTAGVPVELETDDLGDLPAGVSLGIYRIVQESLTNTLKHAGRGATAAVRVHRTGDLVEVVVSDDGAGRVPQLAGAARRLPGGNGLIGMRERAHVYGGTLDVGPAPGGGWQVRAELPVRLDK